METFGRHRGLVWRPGHNLLTAITLPASFLDMLPHSSYINVLIRLGLVVCVSVVSGCGHFTPSDPLIKETKRLPQVPRPRNTMRFQVAFVERSITDPSLGDALWQNVDQVGGFAPQTRAALRAGGFRVGHVGSTPPMVLQELLGYRSEIDPDVRSRQSEGPRIRQFTLESGAGTPIQVNPSSYPHCFVTIGADGKDEGKGFENVRCILRMQAERLQDGWVRLKFTPEIHHGAQRLRYDVSGTSLERRTRQEIERLYDQAFSIDLTLGEMVVVTADQPTRNCVGTLFFVGTEETNRQRLLAIRLGDMRRVDPVYAE